MGWRRRQALGDRQQAALLAQSRLRHGGSRLPKVSECTDPGVLGVHTAVRPARHAAGSQATPGAVPPYVPRDADDSPALAAGFASGGLLIIEGAAAAGKTRLAYQAMHRHAPDRQLLVPSSPAALRELKAAGVRLADAVVWLDNIHHYLAAGGLDGAVLDALCPPGRRDVLLLATLRPEARRTLDATDFDTTVRRALRDVMGRARLIALDRALTPSERHRAQLGRRADPRIGAALDQQTGAGFAEFLAAAPLIRHRWQSAPGSAGAAIITAAVDARRAGLLSPLPRDLLRDLHAFYLGPQCAQPGAEPGFDDGLIWATQPVRGASPCLIALDGETYEPFDYLVAHTQATGTATEPVPPAAWPVLLAGAGPADMLSLAMAARAAGQLDVSEAALQRAADAGDPGAMYNLGVLLDDAGRPDEAARWYRQAADAGDASATCSLGVLLGGAGQPEEAEERYRQAAGRGHTGAMAHLGALLEEMGRRDEAEEWYRQAAAAGHPRAMDSLGGLLQQRGRAAAAEHWYRAAAATGDARAMGHLGGLLQELGRVADAEHWYRQAAAIGHTGARYNLGVLLQQAEHPDEAEVWYRLAAGAGHTGAMNNLGGMLRGRGRARDAEPWYRQAAATGDTTAMYRLGGLLQETRRAEEAERWYRRAAATGHTGAMHDLAALLDETGDQEEAERWQRAADTKHRTADTKHRTADTQHRAG
jgi:uncharacterized protein